MSGDIGVVTQQGTTEESIDNTGVGIAKTGAVPNGAGLSAYSKPVITKALTFVIPRLDRGIQS